MSIVFYWNVERQVAIRFYDIVNIIKIYCIVIGYVTVEVFTYVK
jgi:hypothetical protein